MSIYLTHGALQSSTSSPAVQLDGLPPEIIKRIATYLPCQSALYLMRTSRQFRHIINDRLIFRAMIENRSSYSGKTMAAWVSGLQPYLPSNSPASKWAKFAHANEKALQLIELHPISRVPWANPPFAAQSWTSLMRWAPQLMALHHPLISELQYQSMVKRTNLDYEPSKSDFAAFEFCLALLTLQLGVLKQPEYLSTYFDSGLIHMNDTSAWVLTQPGDEDRMPLVPFLCTLVLYLRHAEWRLHAQPISVWPPVPSTIPFMSFMDLPLPFSENATEDFQACHLRSMTSPGFLQDGTWTGYYSLSLHFEAMAFQPPLVDIQFSALNAGLETRSDRRDVGTESGILSLSATGSDHGGVFVAVGGIGKDGAMQMEETNHRGQIWLWNLEMTPIGLVGTWGTREDKRGFLWLWKKDWCYARDCEPTDQNV